MNKILTYAAYNNILIWLISYFCLPLSRFFNFFKITPNILTFFSFVFLVAGCIKLLEESLLNFCFLLIVSIILDVCDGQVARISKNSNKSKLRIDHLSDMVKIPLLFLSFGILFNNINSWILVFITNSLYLFLCILHESETHVNNLNLKKKRNKPIFFYFFKQNFFVASYKTLIPVISNFSIHSLILLLLILIDLNFINYILCYYIVLFLYRISILLIFFSKQKKINY